MAQGAWPASGTALPGGIRHGASGWLERRLIKQRFVWTRRMEKRFNNCACLPQRLSTNCPVLQAPFIAVRSNAAFVHEALLLDRL
jgi:hypothetical protein